MDGKAHPREEDPGRVVVPEEVAGLIRPPWRDWEKPLPGAACAWRNCRMQPLGDGSWTRPRRPEPCIVRLPAGRKAPAAIPAPLPPARDPPILRHGGGTVVPREVCQKSAGRTLHAGPQPVRPDSDPYRDARHPNRRARPKPPYAGRVADIQDDVPASRTPRARCAPQ